MGFINFAELNTHLKNKKINHLYYFFGEEIFLIESTVKEIEKVISIKPEEKEIFYGSSIDIDIFISSLSSLSLFGERKFILVKESNKIKTAIKKTISQYLSTPKETCYLIFINPEKIRKDEFQKDEIIKEIARSGDVVEFKQLSETECIKFVREEFSSRGKNISLNEIETFLELTGNNLFDIKNEMEKLILFVGAKKEITLEDIYNCSGLTKQETIYKLSDAIISCDTKTAILIFNNLLNSGIEISHILMSINRTLQQLLTANILSNMNFSKEEILKKLKMSMYFGNQLIEKSKKFKREEILKKIDIVYRMELGIKSGKLERHDFNLFISDLCRD